MASLKGILVKRMQRWSELALSCGYAPEQVISASQLRRQRDQLGLWVYAITFCSLVACFSDGEWCWNGIG